jgi:glycosidase
MAFDTNKNLRNQVMYSVYVRQYSKEGTFKKVQEDLDRIRALGVDIIWLLPIHPTGEKCRKGSLGSPYAIKDYRAVNPEFGTMDDFAQLTQAIHLHGMKCIIDVVYNHTSPDSWLSQHHPEWFYRKADGSFGNKIGEWADIIDLDYTQTGLWDYQIESLKQWATLVDGFRCDVAPLIPLAFWLRAREEVAKVRPSCIWLSESVEPAFTLDNRARGMVSLSDSEIYQAFDVSYEYDIYTDFIKYLTGKCSLAEYADKINQQEYIYPDSYVKLRFLENHDRQRAAFIIPCDKERRNWTAFLYFQKGMTLLYNGQETENTFRPSLFDKNDILWDTGRDITPVLFRLFEIKKDPLFTNSSYHVSDAGNGVLKAVHKTAGRQMIGLFSTKGKPALVWVDVPEGSYVNLIDGSIVSVEGGLMPICGEPVIICAGAEV